MNKRRQLLALITAAGIAAATVIAVAPNGFAAVPESAAVVLAACTDPAWAEGRTYQAGTRVTYQSRTYEALVTHTAHPGAGWNPASTPTLWKDLGACTGGGTTPPPPSGTVYFQNTGTVQGWTNYPQDPQKQGIIRNVSSPVYKGTSAIEARQTYINQTGGYHSETVQGATQVVGEDKYYGQAIYLPANWQYHNQNVTFQQWSPENPSGPWELMFVQNDEIRLGGSGGISGVIGKIQRGTWTRIVVPPEVRQRQRRLRGLGQRGQDLQPDEPDRAAEDLQLDPLVVRDLLHRMARRHTGRAVGAVDLPRPRPHRLDLRTGRTRQLVIDTHRAAPGTRLAPRRVSAGKPRLTRGFKISTCSMGSFPRFVQGPPTTLDVVAARDSSPARLQQRSYRHGGGSASAKRWCSREWSSRCGMRTCVPRRCSGSAPAHRVTIRTTRPAIGTPTWLCSAASAACAGHSCAFQPGSPRRTTDGAGWTCEWPLH